MKKYNPIKKYFSTIYKKPKYIIEPSEHLTYSKKIDKNI